MSGLRTIRRFAVFAVAVGAAAACNPSGGTGGGVTGPAPRVPQPIPYQPLTSGLPPIPEVEAPLEINVIHPTPAMQRPNVDSTFIYGSVGTGGAALLVNGVQVPVAPNGAFIAYLPTPRDGAWRLAAFKGGARTERTVSYRAAGADFSGVGAEFPGTLPAGVLPAPRLGVVSGGGDTLATGSDAVYARPTPTGTYRWFFPRGARLALVERRQGQYRVRLDTASAWIDTTAVRVEAGAPPAPAPASAEVVAAPEPGAADLRIRAGFAPFLVSVQDTAVHVTVYQVGAGAAPRVGTNDWVRGASVAPAGPGAVRFSVGVSLKPWGYKAFYQPDGTLVVRIRRPPTIDAASPLRGIRIVVDPGHPPAGATGPTGLYEGDANLQIALRLAERLRGAGAEVVMTRTTEAPLRTTSSATEELRARTDLAVRSGAHLLVSVHNNAFGEGQNPFRAHHTSTYYFHPAHEPLARALNQAIAPVVGIPNRGALQNNLALVRPTWLPSVLTESLFMPIPEQEAALRDPAFVDRLAEAHFRGIEAFLRAAR